MLTRSEFEALPDLGDWSFRDGTVHAEFGFSSFPEGAAFVVTVATAAEDADHHPDVSLAYPGVVRVVLTTHDIGGVTMRDVELARTISRSVAGFTDR